MNPKTSSDFDRAYQAPLTVWGDVRIPPEIAALAQPGLPRRILEFGCGIGRFSRHLAREGMSVTGVDFSPVAIEKARRHSAGEVRRPDFVVGDVTDLKDLPGPFDAAFDVGCYHCLDAGGQPRYAAEAARLLVPGGLLLIWALDDTPSGFPCTPDTIQRTFSDHFTQQDATPSRRRLARSHWYRLRRSAAVLP